MVKATQVRQTCTSCHHPPVKGALALSSGKVSEEPSARMQVYELSTSFYSEVYDNRLKIVGQCNYLYVSMYTYAPIGRRQL